MATREEIFQRLDLCCAFGPEEAQPFVRYLRISPTSRAALQRDIRLALPKVAGPSAEPKSIPRGIPFGGNDPGRTDMAVAHVSELAAVVVPQPSEFAVAVAWLAALTDLELDGGLETAPLPLEIRNRVRGVLYAMQRVQADEEVHQQLYRERWGDEGGWAQLAMILQWEFFRRIWDMLVVHVGPDAPTAVIAWVQEELRDRALPDPLKTTAAHDARSSQGIAWSN